MRDSSLKFTSAAVAFALLMGLLAIAAKNMVVDLDLFHEMALFGDFCDRGFMPRTDSFAYTPTNNPVVHHEWATGAVLYLVSVTLGLGSFGVVLTKYLLTFGIGLGCFAYARRHNVPLSVFALLAPIALNVGGWMAFTNVRAQLFTLFLLVIMLHLIDIDRRGKRWWILAWIPVVIAWGNLHGGVVSGIGLMGCYGIARTLEAWLQTRSIRETWLAIRHLVAVGALTAALLLVNPYGWDYLPYLVRAIRMPRPLIPEWNPIWALDTYDALVFFLISAAVAVGALILNFNQSRMNAQTSATATTSARPAMDWFTPIALALTAYMAIKHYRHGSLYAVTWICLVPPLLTGTSMAAAIESLWQRYQRPIGVAAVAIGIVAAGFAIQARFWQLRVPGQRAFPSEQVLVYPVGPVDYLKQNSFQGNLFVPFNLGAFVSWKLYPDVKVSIDSRYEVAYPHGALEENLLFYHAKNDWQEIAAKYPTDAILIPVGESLASQWKASTSPLPPWRLCYRDREFLLLIRSDRAANLPFVDRSNEFIRGVFP